MMPLSSNPSPRPNSGTSTSPTTAPDVMDMSDLLNQMMQRGASDLHIAMGSAPVLRIDGSMVPLNYTKLTGEICQRLTYSLLTDSQKQRFESTNELDISFGIKGIGRVRMNVFRQRGAIGAALRAIPQKISSLS